MVTFGIILTIFGVLYLLKNLWSLKGCETYECTILGSEENGEDTRYSYEFVDRRGVRHTGFSRYHLFRRSPKVGQSIKIYLSPSSGGHGRLYDWYSMPMVFILCGLLFSFFGSLGQNVP